jgi:hypothetical protein
MHFCGLYLPLDIALPSTACSLAVVKVRPSQLTYQTMGFYRIGPKVGTLKIEGRKNNIFFSGAVTINFFTIVIKI